MLHKLKLTAGLALVAMLLAPVPVLANSPHKINESFNNNFKESWFFRNYEDDNGVFGVHQGLQCGTDACASLEKESPEKFLRIAVNPSLTEGIYTNTDVSEVELGLPTSIESGTWTPTPEDPVVMETRVRWNSEYNYDGSGDAVGTSGIGLWNSAVGPFGPTPEYDQIGFSWIKNTAFGGVLAGFTANAFVDFAPVSIIRPASPININDWVELKLIWTVDANGQQTVEYFVDDESIGSYNLPVALHNLSLEMWNDNQEPTFTPEGLVVQYPQPASNQAMDVDYVKVYFD